MSKPESGISRRHVATLILAAMVGNAGNKEEKVRAAVDYADLLLGELKKPRGRRLGERFPQGKAERMLDGDSKIERRTQANRSPLGVRPQPG